MMVLLPLWLFTHFLADFVLGQNEFIQRRKGKIWYVMVVHAAAYAATFAVVGVSTDWLVLMVLFLTHLAIDPLKARWGTVQRLGYKRLEWRPDEVEEWKDPSTKAVTSRIERMEGYAFYIDQAAHLAVVLGLYFTRGQEWNAISFG